MRKIYTTLLLLMLGVIAMAYFYFANLNKEHNATDDSLHAVAENTGLIFSFDNNKSFIDLLNGQSILNEILGSEKSNTLSSLYKCLLGNTNLAKAFESRKIYIGFTANSSENVDFLMATQIPSNLDSSAFTTIKDALKTKEGEFTKLTFLDSTSCYISVTEKSILISNATAPIVAAKRKTSKNSNFFSFIKAANKHNTNILANVYIDYTQLPKLLTGILSSKLTGELEVFSKQNAFAALNYNFGSDRLLLNGYTEITDVNSYYQLFANQPEQKINIDQFFPKNTANYTIFTINDYQLWQASFSKWLTNLKKQTAVNALKNKISNDYRINLDETFPKSFQSQFATLQLSTGEKIGIVEIKNGDKLAQQLLDLSTEYNANIRAFRENEILFSYFGEPFKKFKQPFYSIIDNHFIVANNASSLQYILNSYTNNQLLIAEESYTKVKDQLANGASIYSYVNVKNSNYLFSKNLKLPYFTRYQSETGFKNYNSFVYQLSAENGKYLSNILLLK